MNDQRRTIGIDKKERVAILEEPRLSLPGEESIADIDRMAEELAEKNRQREEKKTQQQQLLDAGRLHFPSVFAESKGFSINVSGNTNARKNKVVEQSVEDWYLEEKNATEEMRRASMLRHQQLEREEKKKSADKLSLDEIKLQAEHELECKPDLKAMKKPKGFRKSFASVMKDIDEKIYLIKCRQIKLLYDAGEALNTPFDELDEETSLKYVGSENEYHSLLAREKAYVEVKKYYELMALHMSSPYYSCIPHKVLANLTEDGANAYIQRSTASAEMKAALEAFLKNYFKLKANAYSVAGEDFETLERQLLARDESFDDKAEDTELRLREKKEKADKAAEEESKKAEADREAAEVAKLDKEQQTIKKIVLVSSKKTESYKKNKEGAKAFYDQLFSGDFYENMKGLLADEQGKIKGEIGQRWILADKSLNLRDAVVGAIDSEALTVPTDLVQILVRLNERAYACLESTRSILDGDVAGYAGSLELRDELAKNIFSKLTAESLKSNDKAYKDGVAASLDKEKKELKEKNATAFEIFKGVCDAFGTQFKGKKYSFDVAKNVRFWKDERVQELFNSQEGEALDLKALLAAFNKNCTALFKIEKSLSDKGRLAGQEDEFFRHISERPEALLSGDDTAILDHIMRYADAHRLHVSFTHADRKERELTEEKKKEAEKKFWAHVNLRSDRGAFTYDYMRTIGERTYFSDAKFKLNAIVDAMRENGSWKAFDKGMIAEDALYERNAESFADEVAQIKTTVSQRAKYAREMAFIMEIPEAAMDAFVYGMKATDEEISGFTKDEKELSVSVKRRNEENRRYNFERFGVESFEDLFDRFMSLTNSKRINEEHAAISEAITGIEADTREKLGPVLPYLLKYPDFMTELSELARSNKGAKEDKKAADTKAFWDKQLQKYSPVLNAVKTSKVYAFVAEQYFANKLEIIYGNIATEEGKKEEYWAKNLESYSSDILENKIEGMDTLEDKLASVYKKADKILPKLGDKYLRYLLVKDAQLMKELLDSKSDFEDRLKEILATSNVSFNLFYAGMIAEKYNKEFPESVKGKPLDQGIRTKIQELRKEFDLKKKLGVFTKNTALLEWHLEMLENSLGGMLVSETRVAAPDYSGLRLAKKNQEIIEKAKKKVELKSAEEGSMAVRIARFDALIQLFSESLHEAETTEKNGVKVTELGRLRAEIMSGTKTGLHGNTQLSVQNMMLQNVKQTPYLLLDVTQAQAYTEKEKKKHIDKVAKALKEMHHEGVIPDALKEFVAEALFAKKISERDLNNEIRYIAGLYKLGLHNSESQPGAQNRKKEEKEAAEREALAGVIYAFIHTTDHVINEKGPMVRKYPGKVLSTLEKKEKTYDWILSSVRGFEKCKSGRDRAKYISKLIGDKANAGMLVTVLGKKKISEVTAEQVKIFLENQLMRRQCEDLRLDCEYSIGNVKGKKGKERKSAEAKVESSSRARKKFLVEKYNQFEKSDRNTAKELAGEVRYAIDNTWGKGFTALLGEAFRERNTNPDKLKQVMTELGRSNEKLFFENDQALLTEYVQLMPLIFEKEGETKKTSANADRIGSLILDIFEHFKADVAEEYIKSRVEDFSLSGDEFLRIQGFEMVEESKDESAKDIEDTGELDGFTAIIERNSYEIVSGILNKKFDYLYPATKQELDIRLRKLFNTTVADVAAEREKAKKGKGREKVKLTVEMYEQLRNYLDPEFVAEKDEEIKAAKRKGQRNQMIDFTADVFQHHLLLKDGVKYLSKENKKRLDMLAFERKQAKKEELEKKKKEEKQRKTDKKEAAFEAKHPEYRIPDFVASKKKVANSDFAKAVADKKSVLGRLSGLTITDPGVLAEIEGFKVTLTRMMLVYPVKKFNELCEARIRYFENAEKVMQYTKKTIAAYFAGDGEDSVKADSPEMQKYLTYFRMIFRSDLELSVDKKITEAEWKKKIEGNLFSAADKKKSYASDKEKKEYREKYLRFTVLKGTIKEIGQDESDLSKYYLAQKSSADFGKLFDRTDCFNKGDSVKYKKQFEALSSEEKRLFVMLLSVAKDAENGSAMIFEPALSLEMMKNRCKAFIGGKPVTGYTDYTAAFNTLLGRTVGDVETKKAVFQKELFDGTMALLRELINKKNEQKALTLDELSDPDMSMALAERLHGKKQLTVARRRCEKIGTMNDFINNLKDVALTDLKKRDNRNISLTTDKDDILKRLNGFDEHKMHILVLLLQDRNVCDLEALQDRDMDKLVDHVNEDKRMQIKALYLKDAATLFAGEKQVGEGGENNYQQAFKTLLSFQLKTKAPVDRGNEKKDIFVRSSVLRETMIDWKLLTRAMDFADELVRDRRQLANVRSANTREMIQASGNQMAIRKLGTVDNREFKGAEDVLEFIRGAELYFDFKSQKSVDGTTQAMIDKLAEIKTFSENEKCLFVRALANRACLDVSKVNSAKSLWMGAQRAFVDEGTRFDLADEFLRAQQIDRPMELTEGDMKNAVMSLLSTQVDDSIADLHKKDRSEKFVSDKRKSALDWKLISNAMAFVLRMRMENDQRQGDLAVVEGLGTKEQIGGYSFDASNMRRNVHTGNNLALAYAISRGRKKLHDVIPTKSLKTILNLLLTDEQMNSINRSGLLSDAAKSGSATARFREKAINDLMAKSMEETTAEMKSLTATINSDNVRIQGLAYNKSVKAEAKQIAKEKLEAAKKEGKSQAEIDELQKQFDTAKKEYEEAFKAWGEKNAQLKENNNRLSIVKEAAARQKAIVKSGSAGYRFMGGQVAKKLTDEVETPLKANYGKMVAIEGEIPTETRNVSAGGKFSNTFDFTTKLSYDAATGTIGGVSLAAMTSKIKFRTGYSLVVLKIKQDSSNLQGGRVLFTVMTPGEMDDVTYGKLAETVKSIFELEEKKAVLKNADTPLNALMAKADAMSLVVRKGATEGADGKLELTDEQKKNEQLLESIENTIFDITSVFNDVSSETSAAEIISKVSKVQIDSIMLNLCGGDEKSKTYKTYQKVRGAEKALLQIATVVESDIEELVKGTIDGEQFAKNLTQADIGALITTFSQFSDSKNLEHIGKAVTSAEKMSGKIIALCKMAGTERIGDDTSGIFNPDENVVTNLGVDDLFTMIGALTECFTDSEMPKDIVSKIGDLAVQGGEIARVITAYNEGIRTAELNGITSSEKTKRAGKAAMYASLSEAADLQKVGALIGSFTSDKKTKEQIQRYSGLINHLKNQAMDIVSAIALQNNPKVNDVLANIKVDSFDKMMGQIDYKESPAMKTVFVLGRSISSLATILTGSAGMAKKIGNDYSGDLTVAGKQVSKEGESRTKFVNDFGEVQTRTLSSLMAQVGVDDILNMAESLAKIVPNDTVQKAVVTSRVVEKSLVKIVDGIMEAVHDPSRTKILEAIDLDSAFKIIDEFAGYTNVDQKKLKEVRDIALKTKKNISAIENMFNSDDQTNIFLKLQQIDISFFTDFLDIAGEDSALYKVSVGFKTTKALYDAGIGAYLDVKGVIEFGKAISDFGNYDAFDPAKFYEKYKDSPIFGKAVGKMHEKGLLVHFIKAGSVVTENASGFVSSVGAGINLYKLYSADNEGNMVDIREEYTMEESFVRKGEVLRTDYKLTEEELNAVRTGKVNDMSYVTYGMDHAKGKQIDKLVEFAGGLTGSILKVTVDPTGLVKVAADEISALINFVRKVSRDRNVTRDDLKNGPLKPYFDTYKDKFKNSGMSDDAIADKYVELYFSHSYEMHAVIGMQIAHAILFAAGASNPLGGIRIKSQAILNTMGLSNLIGKEGAQAEALLFDALLNGNTTDANMAATSLMRAEPKNVSKVSFYRNGKKVKSLKKEAPKKEEPKKEEPKTQPQPKSQPQVQQAPPKQTTQQPQPPKQTTKQAPPKQAQRAAMLARQMPKRILPKRDVDLVSDFKPYHEAMVQGSIKAKTTPNKLVSDNRCWAYSVYFHLQKVYGGKAIPKELDSPDKIITAYLHKDIELLAKRWGQEITEQAYIGHEKDPSYVKTILTTENNATKYYRVNYDEFEDKLKSNMFTVAPVLKALLGANSGYVVENYDPDSAAKTNDEYINVKEIIMDALEEGYPVSVSTDQHYYTAVGMKDYKHGNSEAKLEVYDPYDPSGTKMLDFRTAFKNSGFSYCVLQEELKTN